ncbi:hypothetical protein LCGC14_2248540 [marine sediment metagenome]|uniref:C2H2-type domain-containing protein n=1 Tax=marine sediment metagenome TaxID=412755 RepID=A0A0F9FY89_9ZZZZ
MTYRCEWCERVFKTLRGLKAHCFHPNVQHWLPPIRCPECGHSDPERRTIVLASRCTCPSLLQCCPRTKVIFCHCGVFDKLIPSGVKS